MSLMDHTPGQRQFRDEDKLRDYYRGKGAGKALLQHLARKAWMRMRPAEEAPAEG